MLLIWILLIILALPLLGALILFFIFKIVGISESFKISLSVVYIYYVVTYVLLYYSMLPRILERFHFADKATRGAFSLEALVLIFITNLIVLLITTKVICKKSWQESTIVSLIFGILNTPIIYHISYLLSSLRWML